MCTVYVTVYRPHPPPPSFPVYENCFGRLPKDIPFSSLAVPRVYRREAAALLLLHHIVPTWLQIKLFLLSGAQKWVTAWKRERNTAGKGDAVCEISIWCLFECFPFVKLSCNTRLRCNTRLQATLLNDSSIKTLKDLKV